MKFLDIKTTGGSIKGSNADPDVAALRKKYKDKLDKAYARNASSSEIVEIMNKHQEELVKLYERKNLERKEKSRIRAAELRELRNSPHLHPASHNYHRKSVFIENSSSTSLYRCSYYHFNIKI